MVSCDGRIVLPDLMEALATVPDKLCECHGQPMRLWKDSSRSLGIKYVCTISERERNKLRQREISASRNRMLGALKTTAGCIDCGYDRSPRALDFDHRDPITKSFCIGAGTAWKSLRSVFEEVEKCDVRCSNCHREKHDNPDGGAR